MQLKLKLKYSKLFQSISVGNRARFSRLNILLPLIQINGHQVHGTGFLAARQCLDAARPVVRLMVQRKIRIVESKYATSGTEVSGPVSSGEGVENLGFSRDSDSEDEQQNLETPKVWIIQKNFFVLDFSLDFLQ